MNRRQALAALCAAGLGLEPAEALSGRRRASTKRTVAGGTAWRLQTANGPVRLWIPKRYHRPTAGTVVYVHGYWTNVDGAWKAHKLPQQFAASRQNALFVVAGAPRDNSEQVKWRALGDLRRAIRRQGFRLPDGPIVAVGHSGAFRTIAEWVDHALLQQITLIDGFYGREDAWHAFAVDGPRAKRHKLVLVGAETADRGERFVRRYKGVRRRGLPERYEGFTRTQRRARLLHIRTNVGHAALVDGGESLPLLLRLTPLRRL